jgi:tetratricopeptide (TPR) repeat protein
MADKKQVQTDNSDELVVAKVKDFWGKYSKPVTIVCAAIILILGGFYIYKNYFKAPKEDKAAEAMFKAEEYYRIDSVNLALNGDGQYDGFLRILSKYKGTEAAKLANFYTGSCYLKLNDNERAVKYLKKFSTSSKPLQARTYKLLGDASADLGKNADALDYYKKAGRHFPKDEKGSAEALFLAAYFADKVMKNPKEAITLYKELKEKFPKSQEAGDADNYLAQLGVYSTDN